MQKLIALFQGLSISVILTITTKEIIAIKTSSKMYTEACCNLLNKAAHTKITMYLKTYSVARITRVTNPSN